MRIYRRKGNAGEKSAIKKTQCSLGSAWRRVGESWKCNELLVFQELTEIVPNRARLGDLKSLLGKTQESDLSNLKLKAVTRHQSALGFRRKRLAALQGAVATLHTRGNLRLTARHLA